MCSTTTEKRPAAEANVQGVQPNQAGGPGATPGGAGAPTGPAGPQPFDGSPEHVPTLTFIVERRIAADAFINGANTYHTNCGLQPSTIRSIEHLLVQLAAATTRIPRMRIVTHAHPQALAAAMFEGPAAGAVFQVNQEWLNGFAQNDIAGLQAILGRSGHFFGWNLGAARTAIRANTPNPLTPFGTNPPAALDEFMRFAADLMLLNLGLVTRDGTALTNQQRTTLRNALVFMANAAGAPLIAGTVNQGHLDALRTAIEGMTLADFRATGVTATFPTGQFDQFTVAERALTALGNNFRANLETTRRRFDENSVIDIRGCRAGDTEDYLRALQRFFGRADHLPVVTGPRHFQFFGRCPVDQPATNAAIRTLLTTGANAAEIQAGFDDWSRRSRIDPAHKDFWTTLLTANAVAFCRLAWRANIPALHAPFQTLPGLANFTTLTFRDTIARIVDLFRVAPASVPSAAALTTLDTFLTAKLNGWAPHLLAVANTTTPAAQLTALFNQLRTINNDLGQSVVPAAPPATLTGEIITGYQTALVTFLEANQLAPARQFMDAVKARIEDAADPGLRYYMLQIGLPVFIFGTTEMEDANHAVTVTHNRLVVLGGANADAEYRLWPPLLWAEPLPAGNRFGSMHVTDTDATHLQMMVERGAAGPTGVATCPHPDYMDKVRTVGAPGPF